MNPNATPLVRDAEIDFPRIPAGARHARILELVGRNGFVSVAEIEIGRASCRERV